MFRPFLWVLSVAGTVALGTGAASAQQVIVYDPVAPAAYVAPATVTYSPVIAAPSVTAYAPVVTVAPTVVYSPPVYSSPVYAAPTVTTYSPVVTAYSPVVAARPVIIRPKVYVPGQPVRNFLRAITP